MSKLGCTCGHTIYDQTDYIPYKGRCYADEDSDVYHETVHTVVDLLEAYEQQAKEHPERSHPDVRKPGGMSPKVYQVLQILFHYHIGYAREMFECENCGRFWLQVNPRENTYVSYLPEGQTRGVLRSFGGRETLPKLTVREDTSGRIIVIDANSLDAPGR